jgi:hypothetical protein
MLRVRRHCPHVTRFANRLSLSGFRRPARTLRTIALPPVPRGADALGGLSLLAPTPRPLGTAAVLLSELIAAGRLPPVRPLPKGAQPPQERSPPVAT